MSQTETKTEYETIIGLEVHAQLLTRSKMYCGCDARYADDPPNTHVCPVCLGMPGVLPVINKRAVEFTMMTALALNCRIPEHSKFVRKNYSYPDLMKGYQISQYDAPLGVKGWIDIDSDGVTRRIGITRVHMEEDVAKLTHAGSQWGENYSLVDVNRSGVPLMEIVSEPDIRSAEEARAYLVKLRSVLCCLGVSTGNMEEGSFRCDANISIRPVGTTEFLPKVEIKNLNSFKAVFLALQYEAERQAKVVRSGGTTYQETRGWLDEKGQTVLQRSKEYAHDYRYFPEPDLPPLSISRAWVEQVRSHIPELPDARCSRFRDEFSLSGYDASLLTTTKEMADFFEKTVTVLGPSVGRDKGPKLAANWVLGDLSRLLNATGTDIGRVKISPQALAELIVLLNNGAINGPTAKAVFEEMFATGKQPAQIVTERGSTQISDTSQLGSVVAEALRENASAVADYRAGKQAALTFLVGQIMKATKGRASPQATRQILISKLEEKP
ncbi:MAG: Asp-tRNA(Asn)/Glu-tRNA(Gln) amidotransferase subunit GatB [Chloroflexi bacterium]|nr:Asp-tRNA(Asn)/Glu-tRNA(Gln) amidotransferase subunit GatB [Chloroflexota bacterium]